MTYKASEIQPDVNISILMKSMSGMGKTIAAVSFAIFGPVWLAYFDKRVPIEVFTFYKKHRPDLLDNIHIDSYSSVNANEYLNKLIALQKEHGRYAALITDSVTFMTTAAVNWSMGFRPGHGRDSATIDIPDMDDYKSETSLATQALNLSKAYPGFNIWTAHPMEQLDVKAGSSGNIQSISTKQTLVSYGNKVGQMIPGSFQEVYHFRRQGSKRIVCTDASGDDYAKTCYDLPREIDITDKLFAEVWREQVNKSLDSNNGPKPDSDNGGGKKWKI